MLREILAITGKPGLYKIVSQGNRTLIVENVTTGKRMPVSAREKVVSLGDIAMYTTSEDKPLPEILDALYANMKGEKVDVKSLSTDGLRDKFGEVIEDFDRERVYPTDIKKLFSWYNILVDAGYKKFTEEKDENSEAGEKE